MGLTAEGNENSAWSSPDRSFSERLCGHRCSRWDPIVAWYKARSPGFPQKSIREGAQQETFWGLSGPRPKRLVAPSLIDFWGNPGLRALHQAIGIPMFAPSGHRCPRRHADLSRASRTWPRLDWPLNLEGPTRKPRHASAFSTHSDTQAVPEFHCEYECLKAFFWHARFLNAPICCLP